MKNFYVVIMAGGLGTRFWPYSRVNKPKQFLDVLGTGRTLLQMTYDRFVKHCEPENIFVVTNNNYEQIIKEQLPDLEGDQILLEPFQRNTAPCIAYASYKIAKKNSKATIMITPSDHLIYNDEAFYNVMEEAVKGANDGSKLVTLGIKPNRPETGYGYIQFKDQGKGKVHPVKTFTEKPELDLAEKFIESGDFVWNAGIFVWTASSIIEAFKEYLPEVHEAFLNMDEKFYSPEEANGIEVAYSQCKNISIDYGIMEKAKNVFVVLGDFGWSDLGSWTSLHEVAGKDDQQNMIEGSALVYNTEQCVVKGSKDKLIVVDGLKNYLIADHGNVLLICPKNHEKALKSIVSDVKKLKGEQFL